MKNADGKIIHLRKCLGCGGYFEKSSLIRISKKVGNNIAKLVISVDGQHSEGRGAYLCKKKRCIEQGKKRNVLARSFRCEVSSEIYAEIMNKSIDLIVN